MITTYEDYETAPDDGALLQAEVDRQIAAGRKCIVLPPGDYRMSAPLKFTGDGLYIITEGVTLRVPRNFFATPDTL
jgi:hypothetical protein